MAASGVNPEEEFYVYISYKNIFCNQGFLADTMKDTVDVFGVLGLLQLMSDIWLTKITKWSVMIKTFEINYINNTY